MDVRGVGLVVAVVLAVVGFGLAGYFAVKPPMRVTVTTTMPTTVTTTTTIPTTTTVTTTATTTATIPQQ